MKLVYCSRVPVCLVTLLLEVVLNLLAGRLEFSVLRLLLHYLLSLSLQGGHLVLVILAAFGHGHTVWLDLHVRQDGLFHRCARDVRGVIGDRDLDICAGRLGICDRARDLVGHIDPRLMVGGLQLVAVHIDRVQVSLVCHLLDERLERIRIRFAQFRSGGDLA